MERVKTLSKNFYDDEIISLLPNGDIYLKIGVRRNPIPSKEIEQSIESDYINYDIIRSDKFKQLHDLLLGEDRSDEIDDWDN